MAGELLQRRHRLLGQHAPLFYEEPLEIVSGEGVWLTSADGRRYLDVYNNVPSCGHCHPHIIAALTGQASRLNVHTRYLHNTILDYVERLTALFDPSLDMAMLTCSGSEANELALRMVRHMTGHQGIIVTDGAYHGNTEAVAELGTGFMPEAEGCQRVVGIPAPDSYRLPPGVTTETAEDYYVAQVESAIETLQSRGMGVAGILLCPEFANEGLLNAPEGFIDRAVAAVRAAGGLYIADEVQGGFGRTGHHWWSHQRYESVPDVVTLGKPMGNGHPLAGIIARRDLVEPFSATAMYFNTFAGNPVSCAVGMAVLDVIEQEGLMANAVSTGAHVKAGLDKLALASTAIGDVRQKGLFFGVELISDPATRAPDTRLAKQVVNQLKDRGVLISSIGQHNNVLKMRPPLPFGPEHGDILLAALGEVLLETDTP